jgi:uncharacterized membrane protein (DUF485 family)
MQPSAGPNGGSTLVNRGQIRLNLLIAAGAFLLLLVLVLLMLFTPVFSGTVGGVSVAFVVGFLDFVLVLVVAGLYCRAQNRADEAAEAVEATS